MAGEAVPPPIVWAQRSEMVYLTVTLEDVAEPTVRYNEDSVYFKGTGGLDKKEYEVTIPLYKAIEPEKSKTLNKERCVEMVLVKKDQNQPYWPSLTPDKKKYHWLKIDFNKWKDEEDSDEDVEAEQGSDNLNDVTLDAYDGDDDETDVEVVPQHDQPPILNVQAE